MKSFISFQEKVKGNFNIDDYLPAQMVASFVSTYCPNYRVRFYDPLTVVAIYMGQILSCDGSCKQAIANYMAELALKGEKLCSASTGAYCQARKRISLKLIEALAINTAIKVEEKTDDNIKWKGRSVKLVDGTTLTAPDTKENQQEFPQNNSQKEGLGFPIIRVVGVFSLATGCLLRFNYSKCKGKGTGERSILKTILDCFASNDIALVDRYYTSVDMLNEFKIRAIDFVGRSYGARKTNFRKGKKLGRKDHIVTISGKDKISIEVRETEITVQQPGFRVKKMILVTSLLDPKKYTKDDLAQLYKQRWHVELDFRSIKSNLGMDFLRSKTPDMLVKEMWMYMLTYNVIRATMWQCSKVCDLSPREISFKGALQNIAIYLLLLRTAANCNIREKLYVSMMYAMSFNCVGNRPDRYEPRAVKYRGGVDTYLTVPREEARKRHWHRNRNQHHKKARNAQA